MSANNIDELMSILQSSGNAPFASHNEMYEAIDSLSAGDVPWQSFSLSHDDDNAAGGIQPQWMSDSHEIFYRDPHLVIQQMLARPDFHNSLDFAPYEVTDQNDCVQYDNLMSGTWAWEQAVC